MAKGKKAKGFMRGGSQGVRDPAEFRFNTDEVYVRRDQQSGEPPEPRPQRPDQRRGRRIVREREITAYSHYEFSPPAVKQRP
jgi:hypothetical protein